MSSTRINECHRGHFLRKMHGLTLIEVHHDHYESAYESAEAFLDHRVEFTEASAHRNAASLIMICQIPDQGTVIANVLIQSQEAFALKAVNNSNLLLRRQNSKQVAV